MALITNIEELIGNAAGTGLAIGIGIPLSQVLEPTAVDLRQNAWGPAPIKVLDVNDLARIIAQALHDKSDAYLQANATGIADERFDLLVEAELRAPTVGELLQLIRRSQVTDAEIAHALRKAQIETTWDDRLAGLAAVALDGAELANAIHRGNMDDAGLLIVPAPRTPGNVPQYPVSPIDPIEQAAWHGLTKDQLGVLVANAGLPLSLGEMLQLLNRGKVTDDDVRRAVAHSNLRNEYMEVALDLARRLLTPHEAAEAELRGVKTPEEAKAYAALSGLSGDDYDTLFAILGRPLNLHAITTGLARGGTYGGTYDDVPAGPYRDAIRRSAVRPEYASLDYANRYTYPSLFITNRLVTAGTITPDDGKAWLEKSGLAPEVVAAVSKSWGGGTAAADKDVTSAQTKLKTRTHSSYIAAEIDDATATAALQSAGVAAGAIPAVLALWQAERALVRKQLSPSQIVKAYSKGDVNAATGQPWTEPDALAALLARGYSQTEAQDLINIG